MATLATTHVNPSHYHFPPSTHNEEVWRFIYVSISRFSFGWYVMVKLLDVVTQLILGGRWSMQSSNSGKKLLATTHKPLFLPLYSAVGCLVSTPRPGLDFYPARLWIKHWGRKGGLTDMPPSLPSTEFHLEKGWYKLHWVVPRSLNQD